ncbi:LuxR C-terminal-related transcriptional regulator [Intestinimonas butyriciproducens]|uniref:LuxR C-terminal-related transcriptional regulator n=1 Tax=Intestinimonas butyriciproducens TaxID=1297617 RepID=UPI0019562A4E|nr:helix-turn-helix domain-containing protein [Intestinimonas butyriciproducens]
MDYITIQQAAEKWNISLPLAQQYCAEGCIPGAQKIGTDWAIPASAPNPADVPKEKSPIPITNPQEEVPPPHPIPMPLLSSPFVPGHCKEYVERIQDAHVRNIAWAEYYYFSGQPEEAAKIAELYLSHDELSLRLSACLIYTYANLSIGQIQRAKHTLAQIQNTLTSQEQLSPQLQATAVFAITTASVLLHLPLPSGLISLKEHLRLLPPGLRMFALYVQAHQTYLEGEYGKSIGIVETAFALEGQQYPIPSIYLHLVAVMDYMSLKQPEHAQAHLLAAWKLAQPDDLIEGFGEHHGLLGGMLEAVLKKDWPEDFRRIIAITYRFSAGWRKVHNPETGHPVADNLTTTEFAAAMLAARGWTNQEIAGHLGISPNTVKQYISTALQKLNIKQRKDLKQYMLR